MLRAIAGADPDDPTALADPVPDYVADLDRGVSGLRIGYDQRYATEGVAPALASAIRAALDVLERQGAKVVEVEIPAAAIEQNALLAWQVLCAAEASAVHQATYPSQADSYGPWFRFWLGFGASVTGAQYAAAHKQRLETSGAIRTALREVDVLACPTVATEPFPYERAGRVRAARRRRLDLRRRATRVVPAQLALHHSMGLQRLADAVAALRRDREWSAPLAATGRASAHRRDSAPRRPRLRVGDRVAPASPGLV